MRTLKNIIFISILIILTPLIQAVPQEILFQDDFESYTVDTFPSDPWKLMWNGTGIENQLIVNSQSVSPSQSLKLEGGKNWAANAEIQLSEKPPTIYCEGNLLVKNVNNRAHIEFKNQKIGTWGTYYVRATVGDNGYITCNDSTILQRCEANKWYHIRIKYDSYLDLCDVWVDSILKCQGIECIKIGDYNAFSLTAHDTLLGSKAWFDDVIVYADSATMMLHTLFTGVKLYLQNKIDSAKFYFVKAEAYIDGNLNLQTPEYKQLKWLINYEYLKEQSDSVILKKQKAFEWLAKNGILFWALYVSNELGMFYYENGELSKAEEYFQQSESIFNEIARLENWNKNDSIGYLEVYDINQYCPLQKGELKELIWMMCISLYYKLYQINESKGDIESGFNYFKHYSDARDTLVRMQRIFDKNELLSRFEYEEKLGNQVHVYTWLQQIAQKSSKLERTRFLLITLGMVVIFVVILSIILIRQNKLRNEQKNLLLKQKLFRSQMNPHFIFNSLTSIQNFILDEDAHIASKYLSRFSKLVRNILDSSVEDYVSLEEEIVTIENYLELQKIRFQDKFDYSIEVDEKINPENMNIPPMLAQPFIENSIEHGIKHKKSKGHISIRFKSKDGNIIFEVEDDGVGRAQAKEILYKQNREHKSLATAITHERLQVLNKKLKEKITLYIKDLIDTDNQPSGTLVQIEIPLL